MSSTSGQPAVPRSKPSREAPPSNRASVTAEVRDQFVTHWGEMSSCWGINPAMGKIHGLLYIMGRPMNAEEIMAAGNLSRAAVSMNLHDLITWGVVRRVHRKGDRKEYYEAESDVWKMFTTIIRERKRREVDPTIERLQKYLSRLPSDNVQTAPRVEDSLAEAEVAELRRRLKDILEFLQTVDRVFRLFEGIDQSQVKQLLEAGLSLAGLGPQTKTN